MVLGDAIGRIEVDAGHLGEVPEVGQQIDEGFLG